VKISRCTGEVAALFVVVAIALFVRFHAITTPAMDATPTPFGIGA
jgi:hypothetical protein